MPVRVLELVPVREWEWEPGSGPVLGRVLELELGPALERVPVPVRCGPLMAPVVPALAAPVCSGQGQQRCCGATA